MKWNVNIYIYVFLILPVSDHKKIRNFINQNLIVIMKKIQSVLIEISLTSFHINDINNQLSQYTKNTYLINCFVEVFLKL